MNFKLTSLKGVISLIVGIVGGIWASQMKYIGGTGPAYVFSGDSIIGFIVPVVLVYGIWSLFQNHRLCVNPNA